MGIPRFQRWEVQQSLFSYAENIWNIIYFDQFFLATQYAVAHNLETQVRNLEITSIGKARYR